MIHSPLRQDEDMRSLLYGHIEFGIRQQAERMGQTQPPELGSVATERTGLKNVKVGA
jgi:hypothetical protein